MATPSRPLRALGIVLAAWVVGRTMVLVAGGEQGQPLLADTQAPIDARSPSGPLRPLWEPRITGSGGQPGARHSIIMAGRPVVGPDLSRAKAGLRADPSGEKPGPGASPGQRGEMAVSNRSSDRLTVAGSSPQTAATVSPATMRLIPGTVARNWSGSIWIAARDGSGASLAAGTGQLGGSQVGFRVYHNLTPALALTGRVSTALAAKGAEASAGISLRRGAFSVLAERRFAIDSGGRNDWSLTAVAGVSDVPLPLGVRLDGYAQAGLVGRDAFVDGASRVERTVLENGSDRLSVGAGVWGSVQPSVARLDVGPQVVARVKIANRPMRFSAEWRQRIAGNATPGSGPVVTLGADF